MGLRCGTRRRSGAKVGGDVGIQESAGTWRVHGFGSDQAYLRLPDRSCPVLDVQLGGGPRSSCQGASSARKPGMTIGHICGRGELVWAKPAEPPDRVASLARRLVALTGRTGTVENAGVTITRGTWSVPTVLETGGGRWGSTPLHRRSAFSPRGARPRAAQLRGGESRDDSGTPYLWGSRSMRHGRLALGTRHRTLRRRT